MTSKRTHTRRATVDITHNGMTKTLREWSDIMDIPYATLRMRYTRGLTGDDLMSRDMFKYEKHYYRLSLLDPELKMQVIKQAEQLGIDPVELVHKILKNGLQKLVSTS